MNGTAGIEQPLGRVLSALGKGYLGLLRTKLSHLDIDRNYYALVLIETRDGCITQQELAFMLDTDKVSIVRIVDYLSAKGYVKRVRKPDDRRKRCLSLTDKALLALPEIKMSFRELNEIVFNGIESSRNAEFATILNQIKQNISANTV